MDFTDLSFPSNLEYTSDEDPIPLDFYLSVIPSCKEIHLKLGYFSSKAIQVLAYSFAQFISNGGKIKIISNHFLYEKDKELLEVEQTSDGQEELLGDIRWIYKELTSETAHLINCLKTLAQSGRLEIIPVKLKPGRMAHYKQGLFIDQSGNKIYMDGSCNFTANGLLENAETLSLFRSWGENIEKEKISRKEKNILSITQKENPKYEYLKSDAILDAINDLGKEKNIEALLKDERDLINKEYPKEIKRAFTKHRLKLEQKIKEFEKTPRFPFLEGPRDYQITAHEKWVENGRQGIFAMATGTGKTITSLNCLLNEYKQNGKYSAIILVPSKALLNQWYKEVNSFNFKNTILASSEYKWQTDLDRLNTLLAFNKNSSFIVITTYATFSDDKFQKKTTNFPNETLLIADEAHNIGSDRMKQLLPSIKFTQRIALSATPKRRFDEDGNALIEKHFNSTPPYTYEFSMERAIKEGILTRYYYHPSVVYLSEEEMEKYTKISKRLNRLFDQKKKAFINPDTAKKLLLERKRIIHKAENKKEAFTSIVDGIISQKGNLDYTFIYVPEGNDSSDHNILNTYMALIGSKHPAIRLHHYTSQSENRDEIMSNFEEGYINTLLSMKCLDEGVDIPRAETAIFCSSTGNPRQFIQRRGRVLRKHPDKSFALIHDLVVFPKFNSGESSLAIEKKLIKEELIRVIYFSSLAENYYEAMKPLQRISEYYDIDIYALEQEVKEDNNG